jgi:hypothetical protein
VAKLNRNKQKEVADNAGSGFAVLPDGAVHLRLRDVDATRSGAKGPYWSWEFEIVDPEELEIDGKMTKVIGRRLWNNTSLSKEAAFKMKETFDAFGVDLDTDTDELLGQIVKGIISQRTIQEGARKGEVANQIDRLKPADPDVKERFDKQRQQEKETADLF